MRKFKLLMLIFASFSILYCSTSSSEHNVQNTSPQVDIEKKLAKGFDLLETNCFSCHSPNADFANRLAPPMIAIKKHYISKNTTRETFTKDLMNFVKDPIEENSKMPGAIERFGVMPQMNFSDEQLEAIAYYIYESEMEAPGWFEKHYQAERKKYSSQTQNQEVSYKELGLKYAMSTKAVLGKDLMTAINEKGTEHALEFCNVQALPLTDSMAHVLNASIKRVSDRNRNSKNKADLEELKYIEQAHLLIEEGKEIEPYVFERADKMIGYYPIMTNQMCLQCHGKLESEIQSSTLEKIAELYPGDKATGYDLNELRGIWVIEMDKKN